MAYPNRPPGYSIPNSPYVNRYSASSLIPGTIGKLRAVLDGGISQRLGYVATRTLVNSAAGPNSNPYSYRFPTFATDDITGNLSIAWANWYGSEVNTGSVLTMEAYLEYPAGVLRRITFNGANVGIAAPGTNIWGQVSIPGSIPRGSQFWLRYYQQGSISFQWNTASATNVALGEVATPGTTLTGTMVSTMGEMIRPVAIVGMTRRKSYAIIGDSLQAGTGAIAGVPSPANIGQIARGLGSGIGYANFGLGASSVLDWNTTHTLRDQLIQPFAYGVINGLGAVDLFTLLSSAATVKARQVTNRALFPGKPYWLKTIDPQTDSTDSWATLLNQTPRAGSPQVSIYNADLRASPTAVADGFLDSALFTESSIGSQKWIVNGAAFYATVDGGHPSEFTYTQFSFPGYSGVL